MGNLKNKNTHHQAREAARKAKQNGFLSLHDRFRNHESCYDSQTAIGWTEEMCLRMDRLAAEDHSYVAATLFLSILGE